MSVPVWLATDGSLAQFSIERHQAIQRYRQFVVEGIGKESIWKHLNRQIYLGSDGFVERMQAKNQRLSKTVGVPKAQKRPPAPALTELANTYNNRNQMIAAAYATGDYSYQEIAKFYGLHFTTVGKIVRKERVSGEFKH